MTLLEIISANLFGFCHSVYSVFRQCFLCPEHLQRAVLWPGYPTTAATVQPSLQVTTTQQPTTQHIQLFEPAEPPDYLSVPTTRILVQPQLTIATAAAATAVTVATDTIQGVAKRSAKQQATTVIKIEPAHAVSVVITSDKWLSLHMTSRHAVGVEVQLHRFLTSALDRGE